MKILIAGFTKIKYMPYLNFYTDNLHRSNDIHILYWNRDLKSENLNCFQFASLHEFKCELSDEDNYVKKAIAFLKYRRYAKKVIKEGQYDFIIVLHTLPAVLLLNTLTERFKNQYILDYRDSTYERFPLFQKWINTLVAGSRYVFVSSDGFRRYLPDEFSNKIFTSHNLLEDSLNHRNDKLKYGNSSEKVRVAFWGFIRHRDINYQIIKQFGNDDRFELHYYGREQETALELKEFASKNEYKNVFFHGEYVPEDRYQFILKTDLIHNIYYDGNTMLAMGNKYYDGIIFGIPQLCMQGSFMGEKCTSNGIGLECNPYSENFTDDIMKYYLLLKKEDFYRCCATELSKVYEQYEYGKVIINKLNEEE